MKNGMLRNTLRIAALLAAVAALATPAFALGTPAGTDIDNQATVNYEDANGNGLVALSNVVTTTVSQVAAVSVTPDNSTSANPGDVVVFAHTLANNGNGDDTFDLTAVSATGWTTVVFIDVNANNQYDAGTDTVVSDTGLLTADATFDFWVAVTVPPGAANNASDVTTVTGTSQFNNAVSDSAADTINVTSPELSVSKSVSPTGPQPPGTTLTYTIVIDNNGSVAANNVVMTDPIPANTTYAANSITQDGNPRTDVPDVDNATFNGTQVQVDVGTLASGASTTITFQVTID